MGARGSARRSPPSSAPGNTMTAAALVQTPLPKPAPEHAGAAAAFVRRAERALDALCGASANPLRQLGAIGFYLFWLITATGIWLYVFFDTSLAGAWASVEHLTHGQGRLGGAMRSLHRYASDAFVAVMAIHALREWALGRFRGHRRFSWITGVAPLWLAFASGVTGYWLVWDELALFVGIGTTEWFGALPGFGPSLVRNFVADGVMSDRFFSLMAFLHIGVPLALLAAMWVHVQRLTRPRTSPARAAQAWTFAALVALSAAMPALSMPPADAARVAPVLPIDWFYLAPYPAITAGHAALVWWTCAALTFALLAAPWIGARRRPAAARVDAANCNGCSRCFADCPYEAIAMAPHPRGRGLVAVVAEHACASCGICVGACPSSTPFRSGERLVTGIDLPGEPIDALRARLESGLAGVIGSGAAAPVVVLGCRHGARVEADGERVLAWSVPCAAMLPPSFVEYALRAGAGGVVVAPCPAEDCEFRFGARWALERFARAREPRLRAGVPAARVRVFEAAREDTTRLRERIDAFVAELSHLPPPALAPARRTRTGDPLHG